MKGPQYPSTTDSLPMSAIARKRPEARSQELKPGLPPSPRDPTLRTITAAIQGLYLLEDEL